MIPLSGDDLRWLDAAARIALPYRGTTGENPTVGAIIVSPDGVMLGRGVTAPGGRPHAEPQALAMAGEKARGATLYVTLEPCNHYGRTPPCVDAVIASGVGRVVVGATDPDPRTAGEGIQRLRAAGIPVTVADRHAPSQELHEGFFSRIQRGRPFVTAKLAVSADGMIGLADKGNVPITGAAARRWTHMQRALSNAVMVGGHTAILDHPRLNVRLPGLEDRKPLRVIVLAREQMNHIANLDTQGTVFIIENGEPESVSHRHEAVESVSDIIESPSDDGRPNLLAGLEKLGQRGISTVLVEGGARLNDALLDAGLIDRFHLLESKIEIGPHGVPATVHPSLPHRLTQLGFAPVDNRMLGCDRLTTFENKQDQ
ncbi:bifunctional diaminohydroxyphosphoribosylaminopyrimidine deaminase/5-amino-6-(5-phosphoribosylamino)uracil reductase RibD [Pelagibacterium sediminicola]|uniref:bifunctional diaminohydroxyphosphoribosylaminopyrimidine deaminase/5-amino-6-(5-phosphoribosylamino)uracil reductase RibD n=1 Tax=Pelagibacterium sediminicola TaxID=2248761 RepID=UPI000E30DB5E|nr:bifunctional diaminohydroxyphosphoribosylaminopyrimidine deaminase/5-amino-6-(5-phosphoribosylamino)uracil reductase RibD [Pelagibacterium sediminicola]